MLWLRFDPWSQRFCMPQVWPKKKKKPNKQTNGKVLGLWAQGQRTRDTFDGGQGNKLSSSGTGQSSILVVFSNSKNFVSGEEEDWNLASAWFCGPACPKAQRKDCIGHELKKLALFSISKPKDKGKSPLSHTRAWRYYLKTMEPWKIFKLSLLDKLRLQGLSSLQYQKPNSN